MAGEVGRRLADRATAADERAEAERLVPEVRPLAEALLEAASVSPDLHPRQPAAREALALACLLGRRAGHRRIGPTPLAHLPDAMAVALRAEGSPVPPAMLASLREVTLEGYCAARQEDADAVRDRALADAVGVLEPVPGLVVVSVAGRQDPECLAGVFEEVGRRLLASGARVCLLHAGALTSEPPGDAHRLVELAESCRLLGVELIVAELPARWRAKLPADRVGRLRDRAEEAFAEALELAGLALQPAGRGILARLTGWRSR